MAKEGGVKTEKSAKKRFFAARELQFSIATLIVMSLIGGLLLQTFSGFLSKGYGFSAVLLGVLLIVGYIVLVVVLSGYFTYRLIGPFKRLEYEMRFISGGDLSKRLSVRSQDDLHVRKFVTHTNEFISRFEEMSKDYNKLNSTISKRLAAISDDLSAKEIDCCKIKAELALLEKEFHALRERW